jgi:acetylornithine deacetylase
VSPGAAPREHLTDLEVRALRAVDHDALLALLRVLVAIPSFGGRESPAQREVAAWLVGQGFETDVWPIDLVALARHPQYSAEVERDEALGVVGRIGEPASLAGGRDLLLNGHVDVVPPGDEALWTSPPWDAAVRDGRIYGRGAVDMKGGLCCALIAAKAVRDAGVRLKGRLSVASVVGEEDGGAGTLATLLRGHCAHGAVVVEPTGLSVVPAQAGSLMFRLVVTGRAAHGCVREEGVSAVEKFLPLFAALRRLEAERCGLLPGGAGAAGRPDDPLFARYRLPWPIEVGTVRAGDWASSVPGALVADGRYGVAVGERPEVARRALAAAIARAAAEDDWLRDHPPAVEWWGGRFDPAVTDPADPIVAAVIAAAAAVTGQTPPVEGVSYGSDLRLLVNVGDIPTVLFGPGDVRVAHMADEYVPVADLRAATESLVLTALRYCGVQGSARDVDRASDRDDGAA